MSAPVRLPGRKPRFAYAFYATNDAYAVAVLVFVRHLRQLGIRDDIELLALHHGVSPPLVEAMVEVGIAPRQVSPLRDGWIPPLKRAGSSHFRHCLTKLRVFVPGEFDRVVFADVDALPLKSLDYLFELSIPEAIAAPAAYWLDQPFWTSALIVVEPSAASWSRVSGHLEAARRGPRHDMDILNMEFGREIYTLQPETFCLNSEWEDQGRPGRFAGPLDALSTASVVHFTALGKPWSFAPEEVRRLRPNAHPVFYELWERWRRTREEVLTEGTVGPMMRRLSRRAGRSPRPAFRRGTA
jgi:hypothetical protein